MVGDKELLQRYGSTVDKAKVEGDIEFDRLWRKGYYHHFSLALWGWSEHGRRVVLGDEVRRQAPYGPGSPKQR